MCRVKDLNTGILVWIRLMKKFVSGGSDIGFTRRSDLDPFNLKIDQQPYFYVYHFERKILNQLMIKVKIVCIGCSGAFFSSQVVISKQLKTKGLFIDAEPAALCINS